MRHTHPIASTEAEAPFPVYLDAAKEQVARTRANSDWLNGTRSRDGELARALATMNRDADRADRHYLANKATIDAARAAADRSIDRAGRVL